MPTTSLLPSNWKIPQVFRDRLGSNVGRQRTMFAGGHLLLILHAPPLPSEDNRDGRFFWRDTDGTWCSSEGSTGIHTLERFLESYDKAINAIDEIEEKAKLAEQYFEVVDQLSPLARAAANMSQVLADARKLVDEDRELIDIRDRAYDTSRRAELLISHAKTSLEFAIARRVEEQAKVSGDMAVAAHRLNLLAAFFFPIATVSGILGVNLKHGLEDLPAPWIFIAMLLLGLTIGLILMKFVTTRSETESSRAA
jgi:Mg2+ and Co2+ transporter CorA